MAEAKSKILILVEGSRVDMRLMKHLFEIYSLDARYDIISYNTNIYTLYNEMFYDGKPEDMDILQVLKARESSAEKKHIFEQEFTDILLVFDLDPQDPQFTENKISEMADYFTESTDMGKLYLNFPMVEAFYHMRAIPDEDYNNRTATLAELRGHTYKQRVNKENRDGDYTKFAKTRGECNIVIEQNIHKAQQILAMPSKIAMPNAALILRKQLAMLRDADMIYVLCTCVFFIPEYNPQMLATLS